MTAPVDYRDFLEAKIRLAPSSGFRVELSEINPILKLHQQLIVQWAIAGGRRAIFAAFGLGKSVIQLEILRLVLSRTGGRGLIVAPLGVRQEFVRDAAMIGLTIRFIRRIEEAGETGLYITNYETVRDGKLDPAHFAAVSLDEASCLRGFGGTKVFREFMALFAGDRKTMDSRTRSSGVQYRFVATATPSPNQYIELLAYSAFLGIMEVGEAKTRFFRRNSEKADQLTLHPHKEREFWLWIASWALFVQAPSDLGCSDEGYVLPPIEVRWHEIAADHATAGMDKSGQGRLFRNAAISLPSAAREKRDSMAARIARIMDIVRGERSGQIIIWCDLNDEQSAIERALRAENITVSSLYGNQDIDDREAMFAKWRQKKTSVFLSKPQMYGSGVNMQQCHTMIFAGIGYKFADFIQAIHRVYRFLQTEKVTIDIIYTDAERDIRRALEDKWQRHKELVAEMTSIIREFGLSEAAMAQTLARSMGTERIEVKADRYVLINNDCVIETAAMPDNCIDLIVSSIPFGTQYEYTKLFNDFGHTDNNEHFWKQMDYLVPHLLRVLRPGRDCCIHVKDRIVPGGLTGLGFQTVYPFADDCRTIFQKHGFAYLGEKTNLTDVVRENNQTYRLGHGEQLKDGTRMGCGLPEKVLLFRKPPSDRSDGYADQPVVKAGPDYMTREGVKAKYSRVADRAGTIVPVPGTGYSRARWQVDAHHLMRSSGNRLVAPAEWAAFPAERVYKLWRALNLSEVYDFEHHVRIGEELHARGKLPPTFMLLPPHSWHPDVWTDTAQMVSLNALQSAAGAEKHLCPLPFDIVDRLITQFSQPDEVVLDPFGGLMTVPYRALKLGRLGVGIELNPTYFLDGVKYCEAMAREMAMPTLFDLLDAEAAA